MQKQKIKRDEEGKKEQKTYTMHACNQTQRREEF